jgi:hypothetical protein
MIPEMIIIYLVGGDNNKANNEERDHERKQDHSYYR